MKKITFYLYLCVFFFNCTNLLAVNEFNPSVSAQIAYFCPESKKLRKIYSNGGADYQLEIKINAACNWEVWSGLSYFYKKGHSLGLGNSTNLSLLPIYLGLRYTYEFAPKTTVYVGGAVCYSFLRINDHSAYVHQHIRKEAFGGLAQMGVYYQLNPCGFCNLFIDYLFQEFRFANSHETSDQVGYVKRHNLNLNGFKTGVGFGFSF